MLQKPMRGFITFLQFIIFIYILLADVTITIDCLLLVVAGVGEDDTPGVVDRGVVLGPAGLVKATQLRQLHLVVTLPHGDDAQHPSVSLQTRDQ